MKYFKQSHGFSCGPACARMMLHELGIEVPEPDLIEILESASGKGTPMENWVLLAGHFPIELLAKENATLEEVAKLKSDGWQVTLLILADVPHYVGFVKIEDGRVFVHDPWDTPHYNLLIRNFLKKWEVSPEKWRPESIYHSYRWFVAVRNAK